MTIKTAEAMKKERLTKRLLVGGLFGAALGLAIGYIWAGREDVQRPPSGQGEANALAVRDPIRPNDVLKLGLALVTTARQMSNLVNKV
jgi:hypothetical protein